MQCATTQSVVWPVHCVGKPFSTGPQCGRYGSPDRAVYLDDLGESFRRCFQLSGNCEDINEAIDRLREAVELTSQDSRNRFVRLNNLGISLPSRFQNIGDVEDINWAVLGSTAWFGRFPPSALHQKLRLAAVGTPEGEDRI